MSTFITRLDATGSGPRVAVKDLIDVQEVPTTAGSRAVQRTAVPALQDAACLSVMRAAGARLVGKTNLHELAMLPLGTNPWFGTPVNPLDPDVIPGGSSSGSAVAVANDDADIALGSDTGGSVRLPAACCGIAGLKTTFGRIPLQGVWPLAPSLDTVGPMARDVAGLVLGMSLLEEGFSVRAEGARRVGRIRTNGAAPIEAAIDDALRIAGFEVVPVEIDFETGTNCFTTVYFSELWQADAHLVRDHPDGVGEDIIQMVELAAIFRPGLPEARLALAAWRRTIDEVFDQVELLALPTMPVLPPRLDELVGDLTPLVIELSRFTSLFNAAGTPCTAQPVPLAGSRIPASLQLVGPHRSEELLLPTAAMIEAAVR